MLAVIKTRLIIREFMEVRTAPLWLKLATDGWLEVSTRTAVDVVRELADAPLAAVLYTDIARDGTRVGPNVEATVRLARDGGVPVLASRHSMDALPPGSEGCVFPLTTTELDRLLSNPDQLQAAQADTCRYVRKMYESGDLAFLEAAVRTGLKT